MIISENSLVVFCYLEGRSGPHQPGLLLGYGGKHQGEPWLKAALQESLSGGQQEHWACN
jgi:hypothetical protein